MSEIVSIYKLIQVYICVHCRKIESHRQLYKMENKVVVNTTSNLGGGKKYHI